MAQIGMRICSQIIESCSQKSGGGGVGEWVDGWIDGWVGGWWNWFRDSKIDIIINNILL